MKIFAPDRSFAVYDYLNSEALKGCPTGNTFQFVASIHEYYVVQLAVLSDYDLKNVAVGTGTLYSAEGDRSVERAVTCLNTEKLLPDGTKTVSDIALHAGVLQPLFFGFDFLKAGLGDYYTTVTIGDEKVRLNFTLTDELVFLSGNFDSDRLSRLGWLNSSKYRDKRPLKRFEEISASKNTIKLTGKELVFGNDGFIEQVRFYFDKSNSLSDEVQTELFSHPMDFVMEGQKFKYNKVRIHPRAQTALVHADGKSRDAKIDVEALVRYEGAVDYTIKITAENNFISTYANLELGFSDAQYAMGLGMKGGKFHNFEYFWEKTTASDSVFVGQINAGAILKLYESESLVPPPGMYNKNKKKLPDDSWSNYKRGSVKLFEAEGGEKILTAAAGQIVMEAGEEKTFRFRITFTPFRPLDMRFGLGMRPAETDVFVSTAETISKAEDHALQYVALPRHRPGNPYRNYPFDEYENLVKLTLDAHKHKIGLAIEYDSLSISAHAPETGAFASMGDELIYRKKGNGIPANWIAGAIITEDVPISGRDERDVSYLLVPGSRMDNFFVEGVEFLTKQAKVDGIILSNTSMQRDTAERAAKCIERNRGAGLLELGYADKYDKENGYLSPTLAYADIMPFMNRVYVETPFGFSDPDRNLFELSGIAFGLTGDAPYDNSIFGSMLYAMLPRYGKDFQAAAAMNDIQKILKEFDISSAKLRGFWDPQNPIRVDNSSILCTSFINGDNMMTVLFNTSEKALTFEVGVENKLGFTTVGKRVIAPSVEGLQRRKHVNFGKPMKLKAGTGILITVRK